MLWLHSALACKVAGSLSHNSLQKLCAKAWRCCHHRGYCQSSTTTVPSTRKRQKAINPCVPAWLGADPIVQGCPSLEEDAGEEFMATLVGGAFRGHWATCATIKHTAVQPATEAPQSWGDTRQSLQNKMPRSPGRQLKSEGAYQRVQKQPG